MCADKIIDMNYLRNLKNVSDFILGLKKIFENREITQEVEFEAKKLMDIQEKALVIEKRLPKNSQKWSQQISILTPPEITNNMEMKKAEAFLALSSLLQNTSEWHILFSQLTCLTIELLEQLTIARKALRTVGIPYTALESKE